MDLGHVSKYGWYCFDFALTSHELNNVRLSLIEDELDIRGLALLKLFLKEAATVLILAKTINLTNKALELHLSEAEILCEMSEC